MYPQHCEHICLKHVLPHQRHNNTETYTRSCESHVVKPGFLHHAALRVCAKKLMCARAGTKVKHIGEECICQHCVTDNVVCGMQRSFWRTLLQELAMKPRQPLGMGACSLRSMWSRPGTLKCRFWLTTMAMWCTCMRGTALCNGATRR